MARPHSLDLREHVVAAVERSRSCRSVAAIFGESVASVVNWASAAGRGRVRRTFVLEGERNWLLAWITAAPTINLRALAVELAERSILFSCYAVWHLLARKGITFKRKPARKQAA